MEVLLKEYQWYLEHQEELARIYEGKILIIANEEVVSTFDNEQDAYCFAKNKHGLGNFLIQPCFKSKEIYTQTYYSPRVSI